VVRVTVKSRLWRRLRKERLHMTLIDPAIDRGDDAARRAQAAARAGTDAIMVGGSTGYTPADLDGTVGAIKAAVGLPVILFPTSAGLLSGKADAIYFMIMMNSRDVRYLSREQMRGAPAVRKLGIEPIAMGYVIVAPGMRVGKVGHAEVVPRNDARTAAAYALAAQFLGMDCVYLEAGSGAPRPVPPSMVTRVRKTVDIPLLVGGGIRTPAAAAAAARAGGDIIVTGTVAERLADPYGRLAKIVAAVKEA
jgi:phosphoglycerol geranylgeranyltransferase